ncbi:MarR family transcriptional regulator [Halocatena marina]|uniref:MarR family transcriptional regulator n=1 Tax=Halocatena marina TaxID=2934937 RepID=UPI002010255D|nr:helix-turn-helix domain-containing protein [Halocatena marina]
MSSTDPTDVTPLMSPAVRDLPPSCKLIWFVLDREGEVTQQALIEATEMSPRTVRYALNRLRENGLVSVRPYPMDARQCVYSL